MQGNHFPVSFGDGVQLFGKLFFQLFIQGNTQQSGACAADAEGCTGGADQRFNGIVIFDQLFAVGLVDTVLHRITQQLFVPQLQCLEHHSAVGNIIYRIVTVIIRRQHASCIVGGNRKIRDQRQKLPIGMQWKIHRHRQAVIYHRGSKTAIKCRG